MADVQEQIKQLVEDNKVVLFMKGTRMFPQCGFSARAIEIFKRCDVPIKDVNVLADPGIREGIKTFSNWPTIPQAYIDGEFVGGSDILLEMYESGELHKKLGISDGSDESTEAGPPQITVTKSARAQFLSAAGDVGNDVLRFDVSRSFGYDLFFGPKVDNDWAIDVGDGLLLYISKQAAVRANGTKIDFIDGPQGAGFKIDNPNEPPSVKPASPKEVAAWMANGDDKVLLLDCRGDKERALAKIEGDTFMDADGLALIDTLPRDAKIVVYCHHGVRSKPACEQLIKDGFSNVYNLTGGIDAWSATVDDSIPRY
jgi:monothiol glutaredoxin